jgi:hypothetical protein
MRGRRVIQCATLWRCLVLPGNGLSVGGGVGGGVGRWGGLGTLRQGDVVPEIPGIVCEDLVRLSYRPALCLPNPGLVGGVGYPRVAEGSIQGVASHESGRGQALVASVASGANARFGVREA